MQVHHGLTIKQCAQWAASMGKRAIDLWTSQLPDPDVKFSGKTLGHVEAICNMVGEENIDPLLAGDLRLVLQPVPRPLFDNRGRWERARIKLHRVLSDPNPVHRAVQPGINFGEILERCKRFLPPELASTLVDVSQFEDCALNCKQKLESDKRTENATKGVWLPIPLPQMTYSYEEGLIELLEAARRSFECYFQTSGRKLFPNDHFWTDQVEVINCGRHSCLVEALKEKSRVGIFLLPFHGFSLYACREAFDRPQSLNIPDWLLLGGGWDTAMAYLAYPHVLGQDKVAGLSCPALSFKNNLSLLFTKGKDISFSQLGQMRETFEELSAGALCLG